AREEERGKQRADRRRRAQDPGTPRPDIENVAREDRQERGYPAEQGGDQVERHGAEHRLAAPDEAEAGDQRIPADLRPLGRDWRGSGGETRRRRPPDQQRGGPTGQSRPQPG